MSKVAVVGLGTIGCSWVALFIAHGYDVVAIDPRPGLEDSVVAFVKQALVQVRVQDITLDDLRHKIAFSSKPTAANLSNVTFVQENGPERIDVKEDLIGLLDGILPASVPIVSSSSGLPSSTFVTKCENDPTRVLIGHPFNPPHIVPLVEVVPHAKTSRTCVDETIRLYTQLGKTPILLHREVPGFVANRLQAAVNSEALSLVQRGIISAADIDRLVVAGPGLRWAAQGPILTNVLGGGQLGLEHQLRHLGPNRARWIEDMRQHEFDYLDPASIEEVIARCHDYVASIDTDKAAQRRDVLLRAITSLPVA